MQQRRAMLDVVDRGELTVSEACRLYRCSRQTFYEYRRRRVLDGDAGLENRSSRPRRSPGRIDALLEARIVAMRRAHRRWGARRIRVELVRAGVVCPPARATIHGVLIRNGLVRPVAAQPKPEVRRFRREHPNELWQTDAKDVLLRDGVKVHVISELDDHSRLCAWLWAFPSLSAAAAIKVFDAASSAYGLPESVLADRGVIFTGLTAQCVNEFERHLWSVGVYTLNGRGYHPQTQGKVERYHRTLNEWLVDHGPFDTIDDLNASLVEFRHDYNDERPHQGDGMNDRTPAEVFSATDRAGVDPAKALERCRRETVRRSTATGNIAYADWIIGLGRVWARTEVRVIDYGSIIEIYSADSDLIRQVKPDYNRHYLGTAKPRGRPRHH